MTIFSSAEGRVTFPRRSKLQSAEAAAVVLRDHLIRAFGANAKVDGAVVSFSVRWMNLRPVNKTHSAVSTGVFKVHLEAEEIIVSYVFGFDPMYSVYHPVLGSFLLAGGAFLTFIPGATEVGLFLLIGGLLSTGVAFLHRRGSVGSFRRTLLKALG